MKKDERDPKVINLEKILLTARNAAGWSATEFGDKIGVTRQTINKLEAASKTKYFLTKTLYMAMRRAFDEEIKKNPRKTKMLKDLLEAYVDYPEAFTDEQRKKIKEQAEYLAPSIISKKDNVSHSIKVYNDWTKILGVLGIAIGAGITAYLATSGVKKK